MLPELIDNKNKTLKDDLSTEIKSGSKLAIAAACFSIYAFQELKDELSSIDELRFIFTSPTFTTEKAKKERREFYIPRLDKQIADKEYREKLEKEIAKLEKLARAEKQPKKKFELVQQINNLKKQL